MKDTSSFYEGGTSKQVPCLSNQRVFTVLENEDFKNVLVISDVCYGKAFSYASLWCETAVSTKSNHSNYFKVALIIQQ